MAAQPSGNKMAFSFKKTAPKQPVLAVTPSPLSSANLKDSSIEAPRIESVVLIEDNNIVTNGPSTNEPAPLVIPCERNDWRGEMRKRANIETENKSTNAEDGATTATATISESLPKLVKSTPDEQLERKLALTDSTTAEAVRLVLEDAAKAASDDLPNANGEYKANDTSVIPLSSQKRPVAEADARPATLDDYERVPVGEFGLAMLRGMGWRQDDPKHKTGTAPSDPVVRPRGLGLGADPTVLAAINAPPGKKSKTSSTSSSSSQPLSQSQSSNSFSTSSTASIRVGTCVRVRTGTRHYGLSRSASDSSGSAVGRVVALEEEAGRAIVQVGDQTLTLAVLALDTITADEFARASRAGGGGSGGGRESGSGSARGRERDDGAGEFAQPAAPAPSAGRHDEERRERRHRHRDDGDADSRSSHHSHKHRSDDRDPDEEDDRHRHRHHHKH